MLCNEMFVVRKDNLGWLRHAYCRGQEFCAREPVVHVFVLRRLVHVTELPLPAVHRAVVDFLRPLGTLPIFHGPPIDRNWPLFASTRRPRRVRRAKRN